MRVGVIGDTHDNEGMIERAVGAFDAAGVEVVVHCGDITSPEVMRWFRGYEVHAVLGNNDEPNEDALARAVDALGRESQFHGLAAELRIDGVRFGVTHGVVPERIQTWVHNGEYDYVLHGHFHERRHERIKGTVVVNPGAQRSIAIIDTRSDEVQFVPMHDDAESWDE